MRHRSSRLLLAIVVLALGALTAWQLAQEREPAGASGVNVQSATAKTHAAATPDNSFFVTAGGRVRTTGPAVNPAVPLVSPPPSKLTVGDDNQVVQSARVATDGPGLLDFFRQRTLSRAERDRITALIRLLGSRSYPVRRKTSAELIEIGPRAIALLNLATSDPDPELRRRAEECRNELRTKDHPPTVFTAAARLVASKKPDDAAAVLMAYLPNASSPEVADAVRHTLVDVGLRDGKPEAALIDALESDEAVQRGAAAEVLCKVGARAELPKVRKLLRDPEKTVRLQAALALADARDPEAVPVLIELLDQLPVVQAWYAEDVLCRLAEDADAPCVPLGRNLDSQRRCREAWAAWWKDHGDKVDLARLTERPKLLGYTMVVLLEDGKIREVTSDGKLRWEVEGLQWPLDAQRLPGNRLLVAEGHGGRVTERDRKGEVLWEMSMESPLVAQRLPNGNTFLANMTQMMEVDRTGKVVVSQVLENGVTLRKATRLPNGNFACITSEHKFVRFDRAGKEVHSFPAMMHHFGGRLEVLPDGHVVLPQYHTNRVLEYDADGKVVWETPADRPIAAVRLPNGHTLINFMNEPRVVEVDKDGKEVWEYKAGSRVTRAWRR